MYNGPLTPAAGNQSCFIAQSSAELVNLYGPTEVTIDATAWTCPRRPTLTDIR